MAQNAVLRVAVPAPLFSLFDYLLPPGVSLSSAKPGVRLRVSFGRGERCGVLVEVTDKASVERGRLKAATAILDAEPLFRPEDLEFLLWAASYYRHPPGEVMAAALPVRLRKGEEPVSDRRPGWRLTAAGAAVASESQSRAPRQMEVLNTLAGHAAGLPQDELYLLCGPCRPILRTLEAKGWVEACTLERQASNDISRIPAEAPVLNPAQQAAVAAIDIEGGFKAFLLDGVTGSGKTEVYLKLVEKTIAAGRQVLVLVPEIALTPQLMARFQRRIPSPLALLHSGLGDKERQQAWSLAAKGQAEVVLGTRSAIFTPLPRLGLILVDEEHDLSFKQQEGFRYSARDLAVVRAQRQDCPVILGSATPSLESLLNAQKGRYQRLILPERAGGARPPRLDLIDIRATTLDAGLSPALLRYMEQTLAAGNQVMLFLNRRGYAPVITCHHCGWLSECPRCDARMTLHLGTPMLWCHHCGHQRRTPRQCPECGGEDLRPLGQGTERLEELLSKRFPDRPIARIDRDSTRRKGSLERVLGEIKAGKYPILLGTQMLAKGHHFPDVTLVGILDVDQGLFGADYRAAERMAQLIEQVSGRAGRAEKPGRVLIQTRHPDHPLLQTLVHQGYGAFAKECLRERQEAQLPPFSHQVLLRAEAQSGEAPMAFLSEAAEVARALVSPRVEIWGPVPAPMERRAGRVRAQLLLQAPQRGELQALLGTWLPQLERLKSCRRVRWSIDVDPQEML